MSLVGGADQPAGDCTRLPFRRTPCRLRRWDFLAQIAQHGDFALVPVTAFQPPRRLRHCRNRRRSGFARRASAVLRDIAAGEVGGQQSSSHVAGSSGRQSGVAAYFRHDFAGARAAFFGGAAGVPGRSERPARPRSPRLRSTAAGRARRQVERAIEINPDAAEFRLTLAQILAATDATESARAEAMQAARDPLLREAALALLSRLPSREAPVTATQQPARLSPCSCGSGRRHKDCHGKIGSLTSESEAPRPIDANATVIQQAGAAMQAGEATRAITLLSAVSVNNVIDATLAIDAGSLLLAAGDANAASPWFARAFAT